MAATTRSFVVFKDEPEAPAPPAVEKKETLSGSSATYVLAPPPGPLLVYAPDKENIDPLTGTRANAEQVSGKKRKTALTVKAQATSPTKRLRPLAEKAAKKSVSKARVAEKKTKRASTKRTTAASRSKREPSLPRVTEENESAEQAVIDSKCKDLTVLPLADISEAYDVAAGKEGGAVETEERVAKEAEAEVCLSSSIRATNAAAPTPVESEPAPDSTSPAPTTNAFSTPERKRIYSAFTFTSPSPAGKRLASSRGSAVGRFSDAAL
ncbi:hypothetical protein C8Q77DRAFT_1061876 [Trametes polyzona]|nr:hypothetical protein C8Q77DRAFT_1061876 [Trametes polyzona]